AGSDGEARVPEGVHARRAIVLHARDGAAEQLERVGEGVAAEGREDGAHPCGLDALALTARVGECLVDGVAEEVLRALLVELPERRAADADDRDPPTELERHAGLLPTGDRSDHGYRCPMH